MDREDLRTAIKAARTFERGARAAAVSPESLVAELRTEARLWHLRQPEAQHSSANFTHRFIGDWRNNRLWRRFRAQAFYSGVQYEKL